MANQKHLEILSQGVEAWNTWRKKNPHILPELDGAILREWKLRYANFSQTNMVNANLSYSDLRDTNFVRANLRAADLTNADLKHANMQGADLSSSRLLKTSFYKASLPNAKLVKANLASSLLVDTNLENADLTGAKIFGVAAWKLELKDTIQKDLLITSDDEPAITVDNLEVAQFIYLLLYNKNIRQVIDTITSKVVLILGRFTPERKTVLDAIREELRNHDLLPVLFDFEKPASRDIHETITTLARMARFVVADITDPKSIPQELVSIVEQLPSLPVQPILQEGSEPWGMYDHIKRYPWVLTIHRYRDLDDLLTSLKNEVIEPADAMAKELQRK